DLSKVSGLTDEQLKAITAIYQGARNDKGAIYPGFAPVAECVPSEWIAWLIGPAPALANNHVPDLTFAFATQIFNYLIFNDADWVSVIVDWVEQGRAPDTLIASKKQNGKVVMTRPLYPYPDHAIFKGSGDTNSAESFVLKH